ncbi:putative cyclin-D7-1 [Malania oleifera]|uniref:putative cyclin-D7-1 n=1 Tax=Malania oleifera TaxID=397392 RepID=UPI0025AEA259|nr:putative cyclin-D7-1 [Malania oleifera]
MEITQLLCDEVWLSSSGSGNSAPSTPHCNTHGDHAAMLPPIASDPFFATKEDCEEGLATCLHKESSYMPLPPYSHLLHHSPALVSSRLRAIQWLIKSRSRLNLSFQTLFNAVNYLDRYVSTNHSHGSRIFELVSVACLSVASKFNETSPPSLHEIQTEDLENSYECSMIQRMELKVLEALRWRLSSTTPFSYVGLLLWSIADSLQPQLLHHNLNTRVTNLLLAALQDYKFLEFRPSVVAVSALLCCLEDLTPSSDAHLPYISTLIPQPQKEAQQVECQKMMEEQYLQSIAGGGRPSCRCPSSPVSVLLKDQIDVHCGCSTRLCRCLNTPPRSKIDEPSVSRKTKRKREEQ